MLGGAPTNDPQRQLSDGSVMGELRMEMVVPPELIDLLVTEMKARLVEAEPASEFLTAVQAADLLRCNRQRVYDLVSTGRLTRYKEGGRTLLRRADVLKLVVLERPATQ